MVTVSVSCVRSSCIVTSRFQFSSLNLSENQVSRVDVVIDIKQTSGLLLLTQSRLEVFHSFFEIILFFLDVLDSLIAFR